MDISEQLVPAGAHGAGAPSDPDRRRRTWAVVVHAVGGVAFALSVPLALLIMLLVRMSGSCSGPATAQQLDEARANIFGAGLAWSLLPFGIAVVSRLLRANWVPWAVFGALALTFGTYLALDTTELHPLFCF